MNACVRSLIAGNSRLRIFNFSTAFNGPRTSGPHTIYRRRRFEAEIIELDAAGVLNVEYSQGNDARAYLSIILHRSSSRWRTFSTLVADAQAGQAISLMDEPIVFYKLAHGGTNASPAGINRRSRACRTFCPISVPAIAPAG